MDQGQYERVWALADSAALSMGNSSSTLLGWLLLKKVECQARMGKEEEASQGLLAYKSASELPGKNWQKLLPTYMRLQGLLTLLKGNSDQSIEWSERALRDTNVSGTEQAELYSQIAVANWALGNVQKAQEYHFKALELRVKLLGENKPATLASYNNLGLTYVDTDPNKALGYFKHCVSIAGALHSSTHASIATYYVNMASAHIQLGQLSEALQELDKALIITTQNYGENHPQVAFIYASLGRLFLLRKSWAKSLENIDKALQIQLALRRSPSDADMPNTAPSTEVRHPEVATLYLLKSKWYAEQGKIKQACEYTAKAMQANSFQDSKKIEVKSFIHKDIALSACYQHSLLLEQWFDSKTLKRKHLVQALQYLRICDTLITTLRRSRTNKQDQLEVSKISKSVYSKSIEISLRIAENSINSGRHRLEAFYFSEKSKANLLLEAISETKAKKFGGIPDSLLEREAALKANLSKLEQQLASASNPAIQSKLSQSLFDVNLALNALSRRFEAQYPNYYNLRYNASIITVSELQSLLETDQAFVSLHSNDESGRLYVFIITKTKFKAYDLPFDSTTSRKLIAFRNAIVYRLDDMFSKLSLELGKYLPMPIHSSHVVFSTEGRWSQVPVEALRWSSNTTYLEKWNLSYDVSATLYGQKIAQKSESSGIHTALLCAPVSFDLHTKPLPTLPGTMDEVQSISGILAGLGANTTMLTLQQANEENFKKALFRKYDLVHLASHGLVNEDKPELSEVFLSASSLQKKEDGELFAGEIYNLSLACNLLTLSACQTGLGKVAKGEGMMGLTRAFTFAGAKNMVVSLWTVNDASTARLMSVFYTQLAKGSTISYSLQQAKIALLKSEEFSDPYFWAPFIHYGK